MLLLEPVDDILESRVILEGVAVPECPLDVVILLLLRLYRLGEAEEGQRQVNEAVLEFLQLTLAVDQLIKEIALLTSTTMPSYYFDLPCTAPDRQGP